MKRKKFYEAALVLFAIDFSFSFYSGPPTAKQICKSLEKSEMVRDCREGTSWAFEVVRHESQWSFDTVGSQIFKCYIGERHGPMHRDCRFRGVITQFANSEDMKSGIALIRDHNSHPNKASDLLAEVIRADTTLEQYAIYTMPKLNVLIIVPVSEGMSKLESSLSDLGCIEVW